MRFSRAERLRLASLARQPDWEAHDECRAWLEFGLPCPDNRTFILRTLEMIAARTKAPWLADEVNLLCVLRRGPLTEAEQARVRRLLSRGDVGGARIAMLWLRAAKELEVSARFRWEMAERLAFHRHPEAYWHGMDQLLRLASMQPRRVWGVVEQIAQSPSRAVLGALAVFIVEHLLEADCERYLPLIERWVRSGDGKWLEVLTGCRIIGTAVPHRSRIHALLNEYSAPAERTRRVWRSGEHGEPDGSPEGRRRLHRELTLGERLPRGRPMGNRVLTSSPDLHWRVRFSREEQESLRGLAAARDLQTLRRCMDWMGCGVPVPANMGFLSDLAFHLAHDPRDDVRYRSLLIMDMWSLYHPTPVWRLLQRLARERSPQLRDAAGVCGLEYFLDAHCDRYFPLIEREVRSGVRGWIRMLAAAYILGKAIAFEGRIHALLDEYTTAEERTRWVWGKDAPPADHPRWRDGHFVALPRPARRTPTPPSPCASPTGAPSCASTTSATGGTRGRATMRRSGATSPA